MEQWLPIHGYEGLYEVSSLGRFRVSWSGKLKAVTRLKTGYGYVRLCKDGIAKNYRAHKLVLIAFRGEPPRSSMECRHLNGIPYDNRIENLAWGTREENWNDKRSHGTAYSFYEGKTGELHPNAKMSDEQRASLPALIASGLRQKDIAAMFGVTQATISRALASEANHRMQSRF